MENLFAVNPVLKEKEVVILGVGKESLLMFSVLLQNGIYVSKFLDQYHLLSENVGIMNKPVVDVSDIESSKKDIVIVGGGRALINEAEELSKAGFCVLFDYNFTAYEGDSVIIKGTD